LKGATRLEAGIPDLRHTRTLQPRPRLQERGRRALSSLSTGCRMPKDPGSKGIISELELKSLTELFIRSHGASYPLSEYAKQAKADFSTMMDNLYWKKVHPAY